MVDQLPSDLRCRLIVRHQLLDDPRVPCTTKNSSAAMLLEASPAVRVPDLIDWLVDWVLGHLVAGSDPGLCVTTMVPHAITEFGRCCQRQLVTQQRARDLAREHGVYLQGLGGDEGGVIGALAAVGLIASGDDGRVLRIGDWPDDLAGWQDVSTLWERGIETRCVDTGQTIAQGNVDVGKHLRPNYRAGRVVLFARRAAEQQPWQAVRLT
jgi:hypothetical protein